MASSNPIFVDRPKGSVHPRYPDALYPLDYGYLEYTYATDGRGIDVWLGAHGAKTLTGILCVFDTLKRDMEIKLLIGCSREDIHIFQQFYGDICALYIPNTTAN